jgi:hypothetical protein
MWSGDAARTLRVPDGLRPDGEGAVLVHWALLDDTHGLESSACPDEELHAELRLAMLERRADRRLGDVQQPGRLRDGSRLQDGMQHLQVS